MAPVPLLPPHPAGFPNPRAALDEPDGLLAAGGRLNREWLIEAYANGIFPWFDSDDSHILWWSPSRRAILEPGKMRVRRSLAKRIRNGGFRVTLDQNFAEVLSGCQAPRAYADGGTWITEQMSSAYRDLHDCGIAHSVEVWQAEHLVGGLYGVSLGGAFFGESMFSRVSDASKVALYHLQQHLGRWAFSLIDCQMMNHHLNTLGVIEIPREQFLSMLATALAVPSKVGRWRLSSS